MLGLRRNARGRASRQARKQWERRTRDARRTTGRLLDRGKRRAEALRESLPEPETLMQDVKEQAQPVVDRAMEASGRKRKRSKKPFLLLALVALAAGVAAYFLFIRRDQEPAYLVTEPDEPDVEPAAPAPDGPSEVPSGDSPSPRTSEWQPASPSTPSPSTPSPSTPATPSPTSPTPTPAGSPAGQAAAAPSAGQAAGDPATQGSATQGSADGTSSSSNGAAPSQAGHMGHHPYSPPSPQASEDTQASDATPATPATSSAPSASSSTAGPASTYEAWTGHRPSSRAAWDLPRSASPPQRPH